MHGREVVLAATILIMPLRATAADLVVWWDEPHYAEEGEALNEIIAAFEQESGKQVELVLYEQDELPERLKMALEADRPPDFAFGILLLNYSGQWAFEDRLVDLSDAIGHFSDLFDPDVLRAATWLNANTGQKALYGLPMGRTTTHVHVWKSLLERAGFTLEDIPKDWDAFWAFWCDEVQPAVRRATGREDIWGVGLAMSPTGGVDAQNVFFPFLAAYQADYVTGDGGLVIDDPEIRRKLVEVIDSYTTIWRKGCIPPQAVEWNTTGNNDAFLDQTVVMTINQTLSIPNALKRERPEDYYENTVTIEWPLGPSGEPFPIFGYVQPALAFKDGGHVALAKEFVRFLVAEGWLAHYLDFSGEYMLPPMPKLLNAPFWLDPSDRHKMASVMQVSARPLAHDFAQALGNWRHDVVWQEYLWAQAIHRVAADGISSEQAVDEAIARIKQILSE
jgi:multiple sugar transport system substrate-binding protein